MAETIVVGAGAAGLTAARILAEHGHTVTLIEARDRPGGRMYSRRVESLPVAIELGAEFIHGRPSQTLDLLRHSGLSTRTLKGQRFCSDGGPLGPCDFFDEVERVLDGMQKYRGPDLTFRDFLTQHASDLPANAQQWACEYVEGFDAADPERVSVQWLNQGNEAAEQDGGDEMSCINEGYGALAGYMIKALPAGKVDVRLASPVHRVQWSRGHVRVHAAGRVFEAPRAVISLPAAVLNSGAISFDPECNNVRAARRIETGAVVRVTFVFRERFWTTLASGLDRMCMMHTRDRDFPTWWSTRPVAAPVLTGWAGGGRARRLSALPADEIVQSAIDALARVLGCERSVVQDQVISAHTHNWQNDPFARGAYSYASAGNTDAAAEMSAPVEDTLFFCGEATSTDGRAGLVHGAISTGERAAHQALGLP